MWVEFKKKYWPHEQVSRFLSIESMKNQKVENIDFDDPKGLHKMLWSTSFSSLLLRSLCHISIYYCLQKKFTYESQNQYGFWDIQLSRFSILLYIYLHVNMCVLRFSFISCKILNILTILINFLYIYIENFYSYFSNLNKKNYS